MMENFICFIIIYYMHVMLLIFMQQFEQFQNNWMDLKLCMSA